MKPNLFAVATQELSQDAFITWLLQWAAPQCREQNPELAAAASDFVSRLISLQSTPPHELTRVVADRQWKNIDVWAEINDSHLIIIEDKVGTGQHSNQLARYRDIASRWCAENRRELLCIYIKTRSDSAASLEKVREQGFAVFDRRDFLSLLDDHEVSSDIYNDFRDRLREIEGRESAFVGSPIREWNADDWIGFYQLLEERREVTDWGFVANRSGGVWNAILNWNYHTGYPLYMQIEQGDLIFKVGDVEDKSLRSEVRNRCHEFLMTHGGPDHGLIRPRTRFGNGAYMTVAVVPRSDWLGGDNDLVDIESVVDCLDRLENWLIITIENAPQEQPIKN